MTTLKEYKAMMEGATDAPWGVNAPDYEINTLTVRSGDWVVCEMCSYIDNDIDGLNHAELIAASRNIATELIRVIELAEEALDICVARYPVVAGEALSEIRKLKGE